MKVHQIRVKKIPGNFAWEFARMFGNFENSQKFIGLPVVYF